MTIPRRASTNLPTAIVLQCGGAPEGALNAVRSLGEMSVPITLVTEDPGSANLSSRYVGTAVTLSGFTRDPRLLLDYLSMAARESGHRPVVIPTADPDLMQLMDLREKLSVTCEVLAPPARLGRQLSDKAEFAALAKELGLPVPATHLPRNAADIQRIAREVSYPVILKPTDPTQWRPAEVEGIGPSAKAIRVDGAEELRKVALRILEKGFDFLIQEFIPGGDPEHVDMHALISRGGEPLATFTGRKHRLFPIHAGSGCFAQSERIEPIVELGLSALKRMGFTGLANLNFKRHERTGKYWLLEINPRLSQWNILDARCGVNLPYLAYAEAAGLPLPRPGRQQEGPRYLNFQRDWRSFADYRSEGAMGWGQYLATLCAPWRTTYQLLDLADPMPFLADWGRRVGAKLSR